MTLPPKSTRRLFLQQTAWGTAACLAGGSRFAAASDNHSLTVTDPIDGAVLHQRLGRKVGGGLEVVVRGTAPPGAAVTIQDRPATREGTEFQGAAVLSERDNLIPVRADNGNDTHQQQLRLMWIPNSQKRYRVVIDDNSFFLRDITQQRYDSLFDCFYLKILRDLHSRHGVKFTLNIYFTTGDDWDLRQFPDKYRDEWRENASWLRLAFHAHADQPPRPYQDAPVAKLMADVQQVDEQILRFAGPEVYSPPTVIHWAMTRPEAWKALYDYGARLLSGYFVDWNGWDINYNLDDFRSEWLSRHDLLKDYDSGIVFSKVDMVVDNTPLDQVVPRLDPIMADPRQGEIIDLLTHEQYFWPFFHRYLPDMPQRLERAIAHVTRHGYQPVQLQDEFAESE